MPPDTPVHVGPTKYMMMDSIGWTQVFEDTNYPPIPILPIPFEGDQEEFDVDITPAELEELKDDQGVIRFEKVMEWCMPRFDDDGNGEEMDLFKWQAKRMSNYLRYLLTKDLGETDDDQPEKRFKPRFFHPILEEGEDESKRKDIEPHHVARLYGIIMARMLSGDPSIVNMYDSRSWFNHCAPAVESMPRNCLQDLYRLLHFVDDWELDEDMEWDDIYDHPKKEVKEGTASHRTKHGVFEDAYVKRWQQCVKFGKWMTADESQAAGWYHSPCTVGPEPKPIRTGCTLHTLCVTHGDLASYKLYARCYGGKKTVTCPLPVTRMFLPIKSGLICMT